MILILMGVSGAGKTTIGLGLSLVTGLPFYDADDFHSPANIDKMSRGLPLDDADRAPWLAELSDQLRHAEGEGGAILACSALKESYRRQLASGLKQPPRWVYLQGDPELVLQRMRERDDHYMPLTLLNSQYETLEPPTDALVISVDARPEQIISAILTKLDQE